MKWVSFLSRVVFICNIFFALSLYIRMSPSVPEVFMSSTTIIIGSVLGMVGTVFLNMVYLVLLFGRKRFSTVVPVWLAVANFLFLLLMIASYFI